ncbi:unnamed protein product [Rotaria sordida]|uniref:Uncharacterized protein n=1 Tax=Rotaria sordida TaxID=392033 RepID=A0A814GCB7_9BILA|nr:unnamed protein product [Rotaria sordida]CAF3801654.1 unnamed protein product [Rotaria sordida]
MGAAIKHVRRDNTKPYTYPLIWLDNLVNTSPKYINGQKLIRSSIDHLKTFENIKKCEEYIRSISQDERIIFIVGDRLAREIIPHIHELRQISSIYIYCSDKLINEKWTKKYKKIKDIGKQFNQLVDKIRVERSKRCENQVNEPLSISMFQTNTYHEQSNNTFNDHFIYSQLLIHTLLQLKPTKADKKKLIVLCKKKYNKIHNELKFIQEFHDNYSSDKALYWYTKDSFIYRMLNKALRTQNIDLLFFFRFFIHDIQHAIIKNQCTSPIRVYRSQLITKEEINLLKNSIGRLISINSFLSTTISRELAISYLNQSSSSSTNDLEQVLFEIDAKPFNNSTKSFCFIKSNSSSQQMEEVLFTLGSIFRLINIHHQSDGLWIIRLSLCQDNDQQLNKIFQSFKTTENKERINILSFGNFLRKIGKLNEAEKYFTRLLNELSDNYQIIADCYYVLGCIAMEKNIYDRSLKLHQKSLEIKLKILKENDLSIADSYNIIGRIYFKKSDYKQAFSSYYQALIITIQTNGENNLNVALCYTNLGGIYQKQENYIDALECHQKALAIRQENLSVDQPDLGISHNNIAIIYICRSQYDLALEHYNISLKILQNTLHPLHPEIAVSYCGLGLIYEQKDQLEKALSYYNKTAIIYHQVLSSIHPDVIRIEQHIQRISSKLNNNGKQLYK